MRSRRRVILATRNPGKLRELKAVLTEAGIELLGLDDVDAPRSIPEPAETGATFAENARDKARYYARATGLWALADDSGLLVDALTGRPGVQSARFAAERCPPGAPRAAIDAANNEKLLAELADVPDEARSARFVCHLALCDGERILLEATGAIEGRMGRRPSGHNGFGYDPLFYLPPDYRRTTADLLADEKNAISHRGQATRRLTEELKRLTADSGAPDR